MVQVPKIKLSDGLEMPVVGFGTYARKAEPGQYRQSVLWGIEAGYRHIDTASCYGNEVEVGEAIAAKIKEGAVTREELFVTTKIQRGIAVLPKSFTKSRLEENIDIFDFTLSDSDMAVVGSLNIDHRCVPGTAFRGFNNFPF